MDSIREQRDDRQGVLRQAREDHKSKGSYLNYYDDLGFSTTDAGAKNIRKDEQNFQEYVGEKKGILGEQLTTINKSQADVNSAYSTQRGTLDKQMAELPTASESVATAWNKEESKLIPVHVTSQIWQTSDSPQGVKGTYYLSKSQVDSLNSGWSDRKEGDYDNRWSSDGNYFLIADSAIGGQGHGTQAILETLKSGQDNYKDSFKTQAYDAYNASMKEAQAQYDTQIGVLNEERDTANAQINVAREDYNTAKGIVDASVSSREGQWKAVRDGYQNKLQAMRDVIGGLNITEGGK